jgi:hypothetical protein
MSWAAHDPESYSLVLRNAVMRKLGLDPSAEADELLDLIEKQVPVAWELLCEHSRSQIGIAESEHLLSRYV